MYICYLIVRFGISVVERDYHHLHLRNIGAEFADIDIDERTGVLVVDRDDVAGGSEAVIHKATVLSLKYTHCWLIVVSNTSE